MYNRIQNRPEAARSELERFYLHLVNHIVADICDANDIEPNGENFVFTAEFPSRVLGSTPYDFLGEMPPDIDDRQFYLYVRDNNAEIGYVRYFISSYNSEQFADRVAAEYLRDHIAYFASDYICRFITNPDTRRALQNDSAVLLAIQNAEGHEFLYSLVDRDEMTADIIDNGELGMHELIGIDDEDYGSYCTFRWSGSNDPIQYFAAICE
jgi:hypothetical protein